MFGKLGDMAGMFKQVQEMQKKMAKVQEELAELEAEGASSCGGAVAVFTCDMKIQSVTLSDSVFEEGKNTVEAAVTEAVGNAIEKAQATAAEKMSEVTGGLNIPGLT